MESHETDKTVARAENPAANYARVDEVQRQFRLSKGTIYNLLRSGRIRGCNLKVKGKKSRIRLIDVSSISALIEREMNEQGKEVAS